MTAGCGSWGRGGGTKPPTEMLGREMRWEYVKWPEVGCDGIGGFL